MTSLGLRYVREAEEGEERVRNVTRAENVVRFVENVARNGNMSIEEACRMGGIAILTYTGAEVILENTFETAS